MDDAYSIRFIVFSAWRKLGGPLVRSELTILRPTPPGQDDDWDAFPEFSLHQVQVLLTKEEDRGVLAGVSNVQARDAELAELAVELKKPVVITTNRFGELTLDRYLRRFEGHASWNGERIQISFRADENYAVHAGLAVAEALWNDQATWKRKVEDFAVKKLLRLKNDNWLDDGEVPLTAQQFKSRMQLESVSFGQDGEFDFWHNDGDLFWGHSIQISGSLTKGLTRADIPG